MGFLINRAQFLEIGQKARDVVDPILTTVFGVDSPRTRNTGQPHYAYRGSASYFSYSGFPFIITARHVLDQEQKTDHLFHGKGKDAAFPLRSGWYAYHDEELDIAVMGCFQQALDEAGIIPFSYAYLLAPSFDHKDAFYYCNGFPGANALYIPFLGEFSITGNPFIGKIAQLPNDFDSEKSFAIDYPSSLEPMGMSGAPVWNLRLHCMSSLESWCPDVVTLAGIIHRWVPEKRILIATRVEYLRDFIPKAIDHLRQKYQWKDGNDTY